MRPVDVEPDALARSDGSAPPGDDPVARVFEVGNLRVDESQLKVKARRRHTIPDPNECRKVLDCTRVQSYSERYAFECNP